MGKPYRVLREGGDLLIWDVAFPSRTEPKRDIAVFPMSIKLPKEEIDTGYGAHWPASGRVTDHYAELARSVGFKVVELQKQDQWFLMRLEK
jgi:hypothetical protein